MTRQPTRPDPIVTVEDVQAAIDQIRADADNWDRAMGHGGYQLREKCTESIARRAVSDFNRYDRKGRQRIASKVRRHLVKLGIRHTTGRVKERARRGSIITVTRTTWYL